MGTRTTAQKALLTTTGKELIDYNVYDKDGTFIDTYELDVLLKAPVILRPINQSLTVEYLRPIKKVIRETVLKKINIVNNDPMSNYGGFRMDFFNNGLTRAMVETNSKSLSGERLIKGLYAETDSGNIDATSSQVSIENLGSLTTVRVGNKYQIGFSYYIENTVSGSDLDYYFAIRVKLEADSKIFYYDFKANEFDEDNTPDKKHYKLFKDTNKNVWNNVSAELNAITEIDAENANITVSISQPNYRNSNAFNGHTVYYIDNFFIDQIWDESNKFLAERTSDSSNTITGIHETEDLILSNELGDSLFDGGFDGTFERLIDTNTDGKLDEFITQEIINDYREFVKRYEGEFYNNNTDPIPVALHNKIWLNFANNTLTEDVSAYIDSMSYNVKANTYNIIMHLPNQDDDLTSSYKIRYE